MSPIQNVQASIIWPTWLFPMLQTFHAGVVFKLLGSVFSGCLCTATAPLGRGSLTLVCQRALSTGFNNQARFCEGEPNGVPQSQESFHPAQKEKDLNSGMTMFCISISRGHINICRIECLLVA